MNKILGISAFYHDSAASLIINGKIVASVQEERFTRVKHDSSYPFNSINWILKSSNLKLSEIDKIIFYENPQLKFKRIIKMPKLKNNSYNILRKPLPKSIDAIKYF